MTTALAIKTPNTTITPAILRSSDGVRMPFGRLKRVEKVRGVGSLCKFLQITYRELAGLLASAVGHLYSKSTLCTWASLEHMKRAPAGWYEKYWMPEFVERAFRELIRQAVLQLSGRRYIACVTGTHRWKVTLRRIA